MFNFIVSTEKYWYDYAITMVIVYVLLLDLGSTPYYWFLENTRWPSYCFINKIRRKNCCSLPNLYFRRIGQKETLPFPRTELITNYISLCVLDNISFRNIRESPYDFFYNIGESTISGKQIGPIVLMGQKEICFILRALTKTQQNNLFALVGYTCLHQLG